MREPHICEHDPSTGDALRQAIADYTMGDDDPARVVQLFHLIRTANGLPEGDYGEFGVHRGMTTKIIHRFMDQARTLYAFDTFEGFDARDVAAEWADTPPSYADGFHPTSPELVRQYLGTPANLRIIAGWFPDSFRDYGEVVWRFVHLDFDLYQPISTALRLLWPRLVPGGIVAVHDYGCYGFPGARRAVDEFCSETGVLPVELADRWGTAAFRKPA